MWSDPSAQIFRFIWFMPSLGVRSPWWGLLTQLPKRPCGTNQLIRRLSAIYEWGKFLISSVFCPNHPLGDIKKCFANVGKNKTIKNLQSEHFFLDLYHQKLWKYFPTFFNKKVKYLTLTLKIHCSPEVSFFQVCNRGGLWLRPNVKMHRSFTGLLSGG